MLCVAVSYRDMERIAGVELTEYILRTRIRAYIHSCALLNGASFRISVCLTHHPCVKKRIHQSEIGRAGEVKRAAAFNVVDKL